MIWQLAIGTLAGAAVGVASTHLGENRPAARLLRRGAVVGGLLGGLVALIMGSPRGDITRANTTGTGDTAAAATTLAAPDSPTAVVHIRGDADFTARVLEADVPCVVDFYSERCPPCRLLAPTIERLATRLVGKVVVCKVSLDDSANRALAVRHEIRGIPTVLFFSGGSEVARLVGWRGEDEYLAVLNRLPSPSRPSPPSLPTP